MAHDAIRLSDAKLIIKIAMKNKTPVMMWGPPGTGKSSIVNQVAEEDSLNLIDVRLAQLDPTDIRGLPFLDQEAKAAIWYTPGFFPKRGEDGKALDGPGILFLDEIEKAPVSVKNAALQLVLDRCVGDYTLPDDWVIICAGNREEDGCFSAPLGSALSNRMIHIEIKADVDTWAKWARGREIYEDIVAFLHFKPELLYKATGHNAFPTPRSWVMAATLIQDVKEEGMRKRLLEAAVGEGACNEFIVWNKVYRNVDPEAILEGKMPKFEREDQSVRYAVALAVAFYTRKKGVKKYMTGISKFLHMIPPELRVVFFRQQTPQAMSEFAKDDSFKDIVANVMEAFEL